MRASLGSSLAAVVATADRRAENVSRMARHLLTVLREFPRRGEVTLASTHAGAKSPSDSFFLQHIPRNTSFRIYPAILPPRYLATLTTAFHLTLLSRPSCLSPPHRRLRGRASGPPVGHLWPQRRIRSDPRPDPRQPHGRRIGQSPGRLLRDCPPPASGSFGVRSKCRHQIRRLPVSSDPPCRQRRRWALGLGPGPPHRRPAGRGALWDLPGGVRGGGGAQVSGWGPLLPPGMHL